MAVAKFLGAVLDIVPAFRPIDLQDASGQHITGDFVSLANHQAVIVLFHSAIGNSGQDPTVTFRQAKDNADGSGKALTAVDTIYTKQAATSLLSTGVWTKVTQTIASTYTDADAGEQEALWAIEIRADDLDVDNGFTHVRVTVADVGGNAQLGAAYYLLVGPKYPTAPASVLPSPIA